MRGAGGVSTRYETRGGHLVRIEDVPEESRAHLEQSFAWLELDENTKRTTLVLYTGNAPLIRKEIRSD